VVVLHICVGKQRIIGNDAKIKRGLAGRGARGSLLYPGNVKKKEGEVGPQRGRVCRRKGEKKRGKPGAARIARDVERGPLWALQTGKREEIKCSLDLS